MILSAQAIRRLQPIRPILERQQHAESGCSFGLSACGYDVRLDQDIEISPGCFVLASTMEEFQIPHNVVARVCDKSTWARRGIAVQNTVAEPGWRGFLTLEISCNIPHAQQFLDVWQFSEKDRLKTLGMVPKVKLSAGTPIAQILFEFLDGPTEQPYPEDGKYQDQERGIVAARSGVGKG